MNKKMCRLWASKQITIIKLLLILREYVGSGRRCNRETKREKWNPREQQKIDVVQIHDEKKKNTENTNK